MSDPYQVVRDFEDAIAKYAGASYGVAVDSCSNALLLSCLWCFRGRAAKDKTVTLPNRTYPSVPAAVIHAGGIVQWENRPWRGAYQLKPLPVIDGAKRFHQDMYIAGMLHCLSFHFKKHLKIGRGGMILTDDIDVVNWLRQMRYDGRLECPLHKQASFELCGYNCYMTPEQATRGLLLLADMPAYNEDLEESPPYPDLSIHPAWR